MFKQKKLIYVIVIVVVILLLTIFFWFFSRKTDQNQLSETNNPVVEENLPVWPETVYTEEDYAGWKTFVNEELNYSIKYPADWTVDQCDGCLRGNVVINPPDPEAYAEYIRITVDSGDKEKLEKTRRALIDADMESRSIDPNYIPSEETKVIFLNQVGYFFQRITSTNIFVSLLLYREDGGRIYSIGSHKYQVPEVGQILASFRFLD